MNIRAKLAQVLNELSEDGLKQVLEFADSLAEKEEHDAWQAFGLQQAARFYEGDESDYTLDDIKPDLPQLDERAEGSKSGPDCDHRNALDRA